MQKANNDLRMEAKGRGVPLWAIAKVLQQSEQTLLRHLREELSPEEKAKMRDIIEQLKVGAANG